VEENDHSWTRGNSCTKERAAGPTEKRVKVCFRIVKFSGGDPRGTDEGGGTNRGGETKMKMWKKKRGQVWGPTNQGEVRKKEKGKS